MSAYRVRVALRAEREVARAVAWWLENRADAPSLLADELASSLILLADAPLAGSPCPDARLPSLRRILLRRTRYHLYYTIDADSQVVTVKALWHGSRRRAPRVREAVTPWNRGRAIAS